MDRQREGQTVKRTDRETEKDRQRVRGERKSRTETDPEAVW